MIELQTGTASERNFNYILRTHPSPNITSPFQSSYHGPYGRSDCALLVRRVQVCRVPVGVMHVLKFRVGARMRTRQATLQCFLTSDTNTLPFKVSFRAMHLLPTSESQEHVATEAASPRMSRITRTSRRAAFATRASPQRYRRSKWIPRNSQWTYRRARSDWRWYNRHSERHSDDQRRQPPRDSVAGPVAGAAEPRYGYTCSSHWSSLRTTQRCAVASNSQAQVQEFDLESAGAPAGRCTRSFC